MKASPHVISELPVVVLFPHNRCNCLCVMCDIWRIREKRDLTPDDLRPHLASFRELAVRWVVFSGGEAQMNRQLPELARMLRGEGMRLTLLTAGLLLKQHAYETCELMDDVIVSLDGPPEIHDAIRRVPNAFARLRDGVGSLRALRPEMKITARTTVQRANRGRLCDTVQTAHRLGLDGISFLAADTTSAAFNRETPWQDGQAQQVGLDPVEVEELDAEMERLVQGHADAIAAGFIAENPEKLRRIVLHFRDGLGQVRVSAPRCNAPWVSTVIEADGTVRPCFFHASIGNIKEGPLMKIINGPVAVQFREQLDVATNETCRRCVCSLYREVPVTEVAATG
jgi:MoaA/NifB/PqqE/SkfB family radical SAM enzyme